MTTFSSPWSAGIGDSFIGVGFDLFSGFSTNGVAHASCTTGCTPYYSGRSSFSTFFFFNLATSIGPDHFAVNLSDSFHWDYLSLNSDLLIHTFDTTTCDGVLNLCDFMGCFDVLYQPFTIWVHRSKKY